MLGKLFKPHWQHSKADVRRKAVTQLDLTDVAQQDILIQLAKGDCDTNVRADALARLTDLALLQRFVNHDADPAIQRAATTRLLALLSGTASEAPSLENRLRAIRLLTDKTLLAQLLDANCDTTCLLAALENLNQQQAFARFALSGADISLREQSALRVTDATLLRQLSREGRDKKVLQYARDALKQQQQQQHAQLAQQQQLNDLLTQLQQHASRSLDPLYAARLTRLQEQWLLSAELADAEQRACATTYLTQAEQKLAAQQQQLQQQAAQVAAEQLRQQCLSAYADFFARLDTDAWQAGIESLCGDVANLENHWQDAIRDFPASAAEHTRQQQFCDHWQTIERLYRTLEPLPSSEAVDITALMAPLADWPSHIAAPAFVIALQQQVKVAQSAATPTHKAKPTHQRARHGGLVQQLRQALKLRHLKDANRAWQRLEQALVKHPDDASTQQALALKPQLDELRDWHAFAADPKKDDLCLRMEALITAPLSHPEEQANAIQALHNDWHELMSANQEADQSLWDRFKQASDAAYDHCRDYFQELDAKRAANLAQRHAIFAQLEGFLAQQDWEAADGNALWQIRCQAPKDWQAASPVRFTDARDIGQRFHQLLKHFDAKLEHLSQAHLPQLEKLLDQFSALTEQTDVATAAHQAKGLQRNWRAAGWVHPHQFRKLDKRKRQLCDAIFDKQHSEQKLQQEKQQQLTQALTQELGSLKELLDAPSHNLEQLDAAMQQLKQQAEPTHDRALAQQKQALLKRASATRSQQARQQHWQDWQQLLAQAPTTDASPALREFCVAMEVSAACPSPDSARDERLAWQVKTLAQAMKSERQSPAQSCVKLLDEQRQLITSGLDDDSRQRLLQVLATLVAGNQG